MRSLLRRDVPTYRRQSREDRQNVTTCRIRRQSEERRQVGGFRRTSGAFFTRIAHRSRITSAGWFDKSTVCDDNMIGGFEEVVTLYRLRRNYPFRDDASGFACRSVFATMQAARNFGHASKNALRNNPRERAG